MNNISAAALAAVGAAVAAGAALAARRQRSVHDSETSSLARSLEQGGRLRAIVFDGLGVNASDTEIVKAVLALGQALGLVTVAEGVERPEQLQALSALGCDVAQGYLFSRPVPADELPSTLTRVTAKLHAR